MKNNLFCIFVLSLALLAAIACSTKKNYDGKWIVLTYSENGTNNPSEAGLVFKMQGNQITVYGDETSTTPIATGMIRAGAINLLIDDKSEMYLAITTQDDNELVLSGTVKDKTVVITLKKMS